MSHNKKAYDYRISISPRFKDLSGQKFGYLTVTKCAGRKIGIKSVKLYWESLCKCGNISINAGHHLIGGQAKSCGCLVAENNFAIRGTHRRSNTPEYISYVEAKKRCENPNVIRYPNYGGRGIQFRFKSFEDFFAELGEKPTPKHSIDRINVDGHYEKGNVRWANTKQQSANRSDNHFIEINGTKRTMTAWSKLAGLDVRVVYNRIKKHNWCEHCAVTLKFPNNCQHR